MALPRPVVELVGDAVTLLLSQVLQGLTLGEILPDEPVGVLVRAALP